MIYNVQAHLNPRRRLVIDRDACASFWKQTSRGRLPRSYLCKSFKLNISPGKVLMKYSSRQFGRQSENLVELAPVLGAISRPGCAQNFNLTMLL